MPLSNPNKIALTTDNFGRSYRYRHNLSTKYIL